MDFSIYRRAMGWDEPKMPIERKALPVRPCKIEFQEFRLMKKGFCFRQVWRGR